MSVSVRNPRVDLIRGAAAPVRWLGTHSCELYLFHLIVLGLLRTALPRSEVVSDQKLILLVAFLALSALISAAVARWFADPLNRLTGRSPSRTGLPTLDAG
ncbi:MAG: hypothetical protein J0H67_00200 [Rhodospirillales bacterium]|nr:hypothetical protein [Rhodospirillales bacterium]